MYLLPILIISPRCVYSDRLFESGRVRRRADSQFLQANFDPISEQEVRNQFGQGITGNVFILNKDDDLSDAVTFRKIFSSS